MSDTPATDDGEASRANDAETGGGGHGASTKDASATAADGEAGGVTGHDTTLLKAALALLVLLAVIATLRFYLSVSSAIGTWVAHEYRDLAQAAFNLVVLLVSGFGISVVLRRLADRS